MKIYVLMPTFNDSKTIEESLSSVFFQTYKNFELIIVDDGSTDNTKSVITKYKKKYDKDNKIKYIYEDNSDQLNAIKNASLHVKDKNSLVYILHSDDVLNDENVFMNAINYFNNNECDAIISDLVTMDKYSRVNGLIHVNEFRNSKYTPVMLFLNLGRNLYSDFSFSKSEVFLNNIYNNYLTWNTPFYLDVETNKLLNVKKVNFPFIRYRIFEENYINNNLGKLCVFNGELRTITSLFNKYYIPCYKLQYYIYRLFIKLKLNKIYRPIYFNKETKNKYEVLKYVLNKRLSDEEIKNNLYLNSILNFYKNKESRTITIDKIPNDVIIYSGSDLRTFNKQILENELHDFYKYMLEEMSKGFNKVIINKKDNDKIVKLLKFLSIYNSVIIEYK